MLFPGACLISSDTTATCCKCGPRRAARERFWNIQVSYKEYCKAWVQETLWLQRFSLESKFSVFGKFPNIIQVAGVWSILGVWHKAGGVKHCRQYWCYCKGCCIVSSCKWHAVEEIQNTHLHVLLDITNQFAKKKEHNKFGCKVCLVCEEPQEVNCAQLERQGSQSLLGRSSQCADAIRKLNCRSRAPEEVSSWPQELELATCIMASEFICIW